MKAALDLRPFAPDLPGFDALVALSLGEGHRMLLRLHENWTTGANRFERPGELINAAFDGSVMIGVAGRNIDPYINDMRVARVRHVYVHPDYRRRGVGWLLLGPIMNDADERFDAINCRAPPEAFAFYEALGFVPVLGDDRVTHRFSLHLQRASSL